MEQQNGSIDKKMLTVATLFSGGGGFDVGAVAAGLTPVFAIDNCPKASAAYRVNFGNHIVVGDICVQDFAEVTADHLHASPVCKNFSTAKTGAAESEFDLGCAAAVCRAIEQIKPKTFSLENVRGYKNSDSFLMIVTTLKSLGYNPAFRVLNSADYGVPQARKRLILLGKLGDRPRFPETTHQKPTVQQGLFPKPEWVSWYDAIADLIPTLKETRLAPWQQLRVDRERLLSCGEIVLVDGAKCGFRDMSCLECDKPCFTILANSFTGFSQSPKVCLIEKVGARSDRPLREILNDRPVPTLKALGQDGHWEQWIISNGIKILQTDMRCLARWQSFPGWYELPTARPVACSIIGNSVPPLLAQRILEVNHVQ